MIIARKRLALAWRNRSAEVEQVEQGRAGDKEIDTSTTSD